jgi:hypothetical protein
MNGRKATIGLCMLCALAFSAFAAQSASAVGTTGFTCKRKAVVGGVGFSAPHCKAADAVGSGAEYEHVVVPQSTTTKVTGKNTATGGEKVTWSAVSTVFGTTIELQAKTLTGEGLMTNAVDGSEHYAHGEGTGTFSEVSVVKPANCEVKTDVPSTKEKGETGVIHTEPLKATTKGQGDGLKFEPQAGTALATFWMVGASCPLANSTFTTTGSVIGIPDGATVTFGEAACTAQGTLKLNGAKAGISGTVTLESKDEIAGDTTYEPLSATT